ncbi:MAG: two pore domain potassium channel family protein [Chlamydiia bacterium]|nr:two pore domain potassium channel family protein [Chlamydiia bacterium]
MDKEDLGPFVKGLWQKRTSKALRPGVWSLVFWLILFTILVLPYFENDLPHKPSLAITIVNLILISAILWKVSVNRLQFIVGLCIGLPVLFMHWLPFTKTTAVITLTLAFLLYLYAMLLIIALLARARTITLEHVFASASLYLLLGIFWTNAYILLEISDTSSFSFRGEDFRMGWLDGLYYSFTTLTTTGYGDITAVSPFARTFSIVEAVSGVLFNVLILGRMIGLYVQAYDKKG